MPDIGVLSIQIKSDASQAAQSLKDLAGALRSIEKIVGQATSGLSSFASSLKAVEKAVGESKGYLTLSRIATSIEKVKTASQGFKTPDFSRLESLMRALQDNFNAESGLKRIAEGMEAIKAASQGFTMPNMKGIEKVIAAMNAPVQTGNANAGKEAVGNISETMPASFETATSQVQQIISDSTDLITTNTGLAANNMQQQFSESFGMIASDAKQAADDATETMRNIGTGTADIVPANAVTEGRVSFDNLREGAIEVEGTVSESLNNIAGYLNGAVQNAAEGSNAVRGYLTGIVEEMKKVEQEAANVQEAVRPEGYGTKASIREIYASTEYGNKLRGTPGPTNFGEALRGELGQNAKYETVKQVAGGTGLTEAEVIHQLVELGKEARKSKAEIDQLIESLNKPIDYGNLSQGVDRMLGIGAAAKSAAESASAFTSAPAAQQIQELMDALNRPIDYGNLSQGIDRMIGIGSAAKSAAESASAFTSVPAAQQIQELVDALNQPIDWKNLSQGIDRMQGIGAEAKSAEDSMRAFLQGMEGDNPQAQSLRELNPELNRFKQEMNEAGMDAKDFTSKLVDVDGELKQKKPDAEEAASAFSRFKDAVNNVKKAIKGSWLGKLGRQFASIAKRMAIRAVIKQITSAFKEGTENVYHYSEAIGSAFAPAMDKTASLLKQMKNSIGAAIAPAIQALLPYINQLVNAFIDAVNWVNQFFALLNGQTTWTKALAVDAKAFEDQEKSAKNASNAVKDMLADWDELNIIQQQGGSGGSGSGTATEDYATMFAESSEFGKDVKDIVAWIQEHLEMIKGVAEAIGVAILAWKLSNTFLSGMDTLKGIAQGAILVAVGLQLTWQGAYAAGMDGGFDAGTALTTLGGILSTTIGGALIGYKLTNSKWGAIVGGALGLTISIYTAFEAYQKGTAAAMAYRAFQYGGTDGQRIDPTAYVKALQKELDKRATGAQLILNVYVDVPNLRGKFDEAVKQLSNLSVVINGEDSITEADAEAFKKAWDTVMETLKQMKEMEYSTLLEGLNSAIAKAVGQAQTQLKELRKEFIKLNQSMNDTDATLYAEMEDVLDRITHNKYTGTAEEIQAAREADWKRYEELAKYMTRSQQSTQSFQFLQDLAAEGQTLDFTQSLNPVEDAMEYVKQVKEATDAAQKEVNDAKNAIQHSYEDYVQRIEGQYELGVFGAVGSAEAQEARDRAKEVVKQARDATLEGLKSDESEIKKMSQDAYTLLFNSILAGDNGSKDYWEIVTLPLLQQARAAGAEIPESIREQIVEGMESRRNQPLMTEAEMRNAFAGWQTNGLDVTEAMASLTLFGATRSGAKDATSVFNTFELMTKDMQQQFLDMMYDVMGADWTKEFRQRWNIDLIPTQETPALVNDGLAQSVEEAQRLLEDLRNSFLQLNGIQVQIGSDVAGKASQMIGLVMQTIIPHASGGFVRSGDLILANENGNFEMMGKMGNQPVVANNQQIVSGISQGVAQANSGVESRLTTIETLLNRILQKEFVARAVPGSDWGNHNAKSAEAYGRVTG